MVARILQPLGKDGRRGSIGMNRRLELHDETQQLDLSVKQVSGGSACGKDRAGARTSGLGAMP